MKAARAMTMPTRGVMRMAVRGLSHDPDDVGQSPRRVAPGVTPVDGDPAVQGAAGEARHQAVDGAEQGGFADAGRADDEAELAFLHGEVDVAQDGLGRVVVGDGDLVESDHLVVAFSGCRARARSVVGRDGTEPSSGGTEAGSGGGARKPAAPASSTAAAGTRCSVGQLSE